MLEDQLKELFEELDIERRPRTFGAVDVIHHGQEVKNRRRALTVAGSALGTTALVVAVGFALAGLPGSTSPATPPGPAGTSTHVPNPQPSVAPLPPVEPTGSPPAEPSPTTAPRPTGFPTTVSPTAPPHPTTPQPTAANTSAATTRNPVSPPSATGLPMGPTTGGPTPPDPENTEVSTTGGHAAPTTASG